MNPVDPLKKSRMIRVVRQYVEDGWLNRSALKNLNSATEGDIDALIERGRARKEQAEGGGSAERKKQKAEAAAAEPEAPEPEAEPEPEPEGEPVSENQISEQEFIDKYPKGSHVEWDGDEYIVVGHMQSKEGESPYLETVGPIREGDNLTLQEEHDGELSKSSSPTKIPQVTEYPPQVFVVARVVEGMATADIFLNHQSLTAEHPDIDGDAIMEAISDPGEPQGIDGGTVTFTDIS